MNWFFSAAPLKFEKRKEDVLGEGGYGAVYRGTFKEKAVAVKVIVKVHLDDKGKKEQNREMEEHLRLDHKNVLKLLHVDDSPDKTCLVLELCAGTLTDFCEKKYNGPMPADRTVLCQIANGLHYIHSQNLVHRDLKPDNILISMTTPIQMKLSDFGYVKKTSPRGTFTQSGLKGTLNWMAPEILELRIKMEESSRDSNGTPKEIPHGTIQSDTFAAGCVFFYFLTRGKHPFGNIFEIPLNILNNNPKELTQRIKNLQGDYRAPYELIKKMIKPLNVEVRREDRIPLPDVIEELTEFYINQFKRVARLVREGGGNIVARFHPKKPVIACGKKDEIIFFSAEDSSIPFSCWEKAENKFRIGHLDEITAMEWNADGTQLAAIFNYNVIVCWSYLKGTILFQKKLNERMDQIEWNPFRLNVFATFVAKFGKVCFFNSCPVDQRPFHFCIIESEEDISSVQWISENRVALGLMEGGIIAIWEIDESTNSAQKLAKRFEYKDSWIEDLAWDERTKCLAACSLEGRMTIWSMDSDQPIHATKVDGCCESFAWRPNGKQTDDEGVDAARESADNFILACGLNDGRIVVWTPLDSKEKTRILSQHSDWIKWLSFSPDGRFLASADLYGKLIIWLTENWEPVYIVEKENWVDRFSWMSSSTDVPDYKLTFDSFDGKVVVIEYADGQSEKPSKD